MTRVIESAEGVTWFGGYAKQPEARDRVQQKLDALPRTVPQDPQAVEDERAVQDAFAHVAMMQRLRRKECTPPPD